MNRHPDAAFRLRDIVADLTEDEREAALMTETLRLLALAAPPAEPPADMRERILAVVDHAARGPLFHESGFLFARSADLPWIDLEPGIRVKILFMDEARGSRTALVELEPNRTFPEHGHGGVEDLYLISGDAWVGDVPMRAGDYCRAPSGTVHDSVRSGASGALAIVVER